MAGPEQAKVSALERIATALEAFLEKFLQGAETVAPIVDAVDPAAAPQVAEVVAIAGDVEKVAQELAPAQEEVLPTPPIQFAAKPEGGKK